LKKRIEHHGAALPDGQLLMSFPRIGQVNVAQILTELGSVRERYLSEAHLAAEAGASPITHQSGKSRGVCFRRAWGGEPLVHGRAGRSAPPNGWRVGNCRPT